MKTLGGSVGSDGTTCTIVTTGTGVSNEELQSVAQKLKTAASGLPSGYSLKVNNTAITGNTDVNEIVNLIMGVTRMTGTLPSDVTVQIVESATGNVVATGTIRFVAGSETPSQTDRIQEVKTALLKAGISSGSDSATADTLNAAVSAAKARAAEVAEAGTSISVSVRQQGTELNEAGISALPNNAQVTIMSGRMFTLRLQLL